MEQKESRKKNYTRQLISMVKVKLKLEQFHWIHLKGKLLFEKFAFVDQFITFFYDIDGFRWQQNHLKNDEFCGEHKNVLYINNSLLLRFLLDRTEHMDHLSMNHKQKKSFFSNRQIDERNF